MPGAPLDINNRGAGIEEGDRASQELTVKELEHLGVGFVSLTEALNLTHSSGYGITA